MGADRDIKPQMHLLPRRSDNEEVMAEVRINGERIMIREMLPYPQSAASKVYLIVRMWQKILKHVEYLEHLSEQPTEWKAIAEYYQRQAVSYRRTMGWQTPEIDMNAPVWPDGSTPDKPLLTATVKDESRLDEMEHRG